MQNAVRRRRLRWVGRFAAWTTKDLPNMPTDSNEISKTKKLENVDQRYVTVINVPNSTTVLRSFFLGWNQMIAN